MQSAHALHACMVREAGGLEIQPVVPEFRPTANRSDIKGRELVQLTAFWLEALWMAWSLPAALRPRQPSQRQRRYSGTQAESKGRTWQGIRCRYVSHKPSRLLSPLRTTPRRNTMQPHRPLERPNTPYSRLACTSFCHTGPRATGSENPELCKTIVGRHLYPLGVPRPNGVDVGTGESIARRWAAPRLGSRCDLIPGCDGPPDRPER
jgi:hypothetical protein